MIPLTTSDIFEERNLNAAELFGNIQAIYHFNRFVIQLYVARPITKIFRP